MKVVLLCYRALKNFWVFSSKGVYSVFVGLVTQLCSPSSVCVERGHMLCAHTNSLSVFITLGTAVLSSVHSSWSGCSVVKITFYLHQTPSWLWLVWTTSPVFTPIRDQSAQIMTGLHCFMDMCQVHEYPDSTIYIQGIDHIKMADDHDVK